MDLSHEDRIELLGDRNKARQLMDLYGAEILEEPHGSFGDVPEGKVLVWVVINDEPLPELAYYVHNEVIFGRMVSEVTAFRPERCQPLRRRSLSPWFRSFFVPIRIPR